MWPTTPGRFAPLHLKITDAWSFAKYWYAWTKKGYKFNQDNMYWFSDKNFETITKNIMFDDFKSLK